MKLEKAIEILSDYLRNHPRHEDPDMVDATNLGIDALNCIKVLRIIPDKRLNLELPGETED